MDCDEVIAGIAEKLREHLREKCHEARLNGDGWRVSVADVHWDGCNASWQVVLLAPGEVSIEPGEVVTN